MYDNTILSALRRVAPDQIGTLLRPISFLHGDVLAESGSPIDDIIFPVSGLVSIVVHFKSGETVEAAMVGRDGVIGGAAAFGGSAHVNSAFVQIQGRGFVMRATEFGRLVRRVPRLQALLVSHEQFLTAQAQQAAACAARHHIPQRMGSWLLRASDMAGDSELQITQEHVAQMLGVQRASVSVFAAQMQDEGLIHYRRGRVTIADRQRLMEKACECYGALCHQKRLLSGQLGDGATAERAAVGSLDRAAVGTAAEVRQL